MVGHLSWSRLGVGRYRLVLDGPTGRIEAIGRDWFDALVAIRLRVEPTGWSICVQGARRDTYPSGMQRDTGAQRVYLQVLGEEVQREPWSGPGSRMPSTFADADPADLGTVAEQAEYHRRWRASMWARHSDTAH